MPFVFVRSILIAAAVLAVLATPAAAQVSGGLKGGATFSTVSTDPDAGGALGSRFDFAAGGFLVLDADAPITVQIEGILSRRGASIVGGIFDIGLGLGDIRLTYVDISALARFRLNSSPVNQFFVLAGPTLGAKMDAEFVVLGFSTDISAGIEDFDVGLAIGAGMDSRRLLFEGRYTHGLRNIVIGVDLINASVKNRSFSFLAGVKF